MEILIQSIDPSAWSSIVKGHFIPTKEVNGELVPKLTRFKENNQYFFGQKYKK